MKPRCKIRSFRPPSISFRWGSITDFTSLFGFATAGVKLVPERWKRFHVPQTAPSFNVPSSFSSRHHSDGLDVVITKSFGHLIRLLSGLRGKRLFLRPWSRFIFASFRAACSAGLSSMVCWVVPAGAAPLMFAMVLMFPAILTLLFWTVFSKAAEIG
jgi:hypothetical protein